MKKTIIIEIISSLFIILFVYAAVSKLADADRFEVQIGRSPMLTDIAPIVAWLIPISEIIVALALIFQKFRFIGLCASFSLMIMFTGYIIAILNFSEEIPCSCGGVLEKLGWTEHLIFNIVFVLLALTGIILISNTDKSKTPMAIHQING